MAYTILHIKAKSKLPDKKADRECEKAIEDFGKIAKKKIKEWRKG